MPRTRHDRGQVLPVLLAVILVTVVILLATHRMSQAVHQSTVVVNAADGAAYSAAVWTARRMNLLAYSNRAMVANHIAVGHLVAYISWLRYADSAIDRIARLARYLPGVGTAVAQGREVVRRARILAATTSGVMIRGLDGLNSLYATAQLDLRREIMPWHLNTIMREVAAGYGSGLDVNRMSHLSRIPSPYRQAAQGLLGGWAVNMSRHVSADRPGRDNRHFSRILGETINHDTDLSRWIRGQQNTGSPRFGTGGRTWSSRIPLLIRFRKQGPTNIADNPSAGGWRSADRLQYGEYDVTKLRWGSWRTLASGRADAAELAGGYRGVRRYQRLSDGIRENRSFRIPALVSSLPSGETDGNGHHHHLSTAKVRYQLPEACRSARQCPRQSDLASLFNPYWQAQLVNAAELAL